MINFIKILSNSDKKRLFVILCSLFNESINYNESYIDDLFLRFCAKFNKEQSIETVNEILRSRSITGFDGLSQPILFSFNDILKKEDVVKINIELQKQIGNKMTIIFLGGQDGK